MIDATHLKAHRTVASLLKKGPYLGLTHLVSGQQAPSPSASMYF